MKKEHKEKDLYLLREKIRMAIKLLEEWESQIPVQIYIKLTSILKDK